MVARIHRNYTHAWGSRKQDGVWYKCDDTLITKIKLGDDKTYKVHKPSG